MRHEPRVRLLRVLGGGSLVLSWLTACDPGSSSQPLPSPGLDPGAAGAGGATEVPVEVHGQLRVEDGVLVDHAGEAVQLKGASSMWLNWETSGYAENLDALLWLRDRWRLKVIRAAMGVEPPNAYLANPGQARFQLDNVVKNAVEAGVYVILDWHDHTAHEHRAEAQEFFADVAADYGDLPTVLYEPYNEPEAVSWASEVKPYHEALVETIRARDPDNVIILGTPFWSQAVDEAALSPVLGDNLLYTLHFYACSHDQWLRDRADAALANGIGLFVTEWAATAADGGLDGSVCLEEARAWLDWIDRRGLSWTAWKLDNCSDASCYFTSSAPVDGGWTGEQLQGHGPFVRERMRE
ncbi:MAG TPA: glycoside hydrolase family 5 protein [Polyangiaceae bacterium]|nr:glycoside hydrolase family 5 protein [Polyangiaceae bacterium]